MSQQGSRQQPRQDQHQAQAVAPVEISGRLGVEAPTYLSPSGSRSSVRGGGDEADERERQQQKKPQSTTATGAKAVKTGGGGGGGGSGSEQHRQHQYSRQPEQHSQGGAAAAYGNSRMEHRMRPVHQEPEESPQGSRCCEVLLMVLSGILILLTFPFSLCVCIKIVQQYERAVIFRLGRIQGPPKGPGLFFIITCIDKMKVIDLRTITFDVPPQEILTKDSVTVAVDAVVYYRIFDPVKATVDIEDVHRATRLLAQTTLRNILGTKTLHEILGEREIIAHAMQESLDVATDPWGVKVERVEVKDVRLPVQMQRAMAAEAEALREAKAKVISAEGEQKASRALKEAADVINESPAALQLRYLQTLQTIAAEKNSTIIFPLPIELLKVAMGGGKKQQ